MVSWFSKDLYLVLSYTSKMQQITVKQVMQHILQEIAELEAQGISFFHMLSITLSMQTFKFPAYLLNLVLLRCVSAWL